jgi:hypothetical protein
MESRSSAIRERPLPAFRFEHDGFRQVPPEGDISMVRTPHSAGRLRKNESTMFARNTKVLAPAI